MNERLRFSKLAKSYPNKTAIITGAGSGLGFALTKRLLDDGWFVFALDIDVSAFDDFDNEAIHIYQIDVTQTVVFQTLLKGIIAKSSIDIIFNNAGVGEGTLFTDYPMANWDWIIAINLKAVIAGCSVLLPHFEANKKGMIVNIASAAGFANLPKMSPYNVTKAGVIALSESLANEYANSPVEIKCIAPTFFKSSILEKSRGKEEVLVKAQAIVTGAKLSADDAAQIILHKLTSSAGLIRFPFSSKLIYTVKRISPKLYSKLVQLFLAD